ncbi:MAG TPA: hypothetical protein VNH19_02525 [Candidatus Limnocylindrales bacterium]|nr:hypothetical protein [Candidatus Limnocylindrales bacterium]
MSAQEFKAPASVDRLQRAGLFAGGFAALLAVYGLTKSPGDFYHSYIFSYMLILGLTVGSLGLLMLQHLTGGIWGIVIRRPLEAASRNLVLVAVLFIPIAMGMKYLYSGNDSETGWLNAPKEGEHALTSWQQGYLTSGGFLTRAVVYFAIWLVLMVVFNNWSKQQDQESSGEGLKQRMKALAAPGVILYILAMTFAAIDWVMSLSPRWASTIYGFLFVAGQAIAAMALMIAVIVLLAGSEPFNGIIKKRHLHDLAKLLFAFNMLWAYFAFSQLLIIWSGNQPEEITFYRSRLNGQWGVVAVIVLLFSFAIPFLLLLSRDVKRTAGIVSKIAIWMIFMRLVDLYWMTRPEFTSRAVPTWLDIVVPVALIGLWLGFFAMNLKQRPLLPVGDPNLSEALAQNEH